MSVHVCLCMCGCVYLEYVWMLYLISEDISAPNVFLRASVCTCVREGV